MRRVAPEAGDRIRVLLILCGVAVAVGVADPARSKDPEPQEMAVFSPQAAKFEPIPDMPSCATGAIVRGNPRNGPAWVYLKLASGCRVPWHWHTANEDMVVISGQGTIEMVGGKPLQFVPGAFAALPSRHTHRATCKRTCLLFSIADAPFDIHYVDASGNEIPAKQAFKEATKATGVKKKK
jgi:quercetin dioxygenase-like cupin family protein